MRRRRREAEEPVEEGNVINLLKTKVQRRGKQSLYRPGQALRVPGG